MTEWISPEGKWIGKSTIEVIMEFEVPSNSQSQRVAAYFFGSLAEELLSRAFSAVAAHALVAAEVALRHSLAI